MKPHSIITLCVDFAPHHHHLVCRFCPTSSSPCVSILPHSIITLCVDFAPQHHHLVCRFCASALGLVVFEICNDGYKVAVLIKYRSTHLSETATERTHSVADRHGTVSTVLSHPRRSLSLTLFIKTLETSRYT